MFLQISFMYTRNNSGPKSLPCCKLEVNLTSLVSCPRALTSCVRPTRNSLTHKNTLESTHKADIHAVLHLAYNTLEEFLPTCMWNNLSSLYHQSIHPFYSKDGLFNKYYLCLYGPVGNIVGSRVYQYVPRAQRVLAALPVMTDCVSELQDGISLKYKSLLHQSG